MDIEMYSYRRETTGEGASNTRTHRIAMEEGPSVSSLNINLTPLAVIITRVY